LDLSSGRLNHGNLLKSAGVSSGVSWSLRQAVHSVQEMGWGKMGIPHGHCDALVAHQFLDGPKINPAHDQAGSEGTAQVVPVEVGNFGRINTPLQPSFPITAPWPRPLYRRAHRARFAGAVFPD